MTVAGGPPGPYVSQGAYARRDNGMSSGAKIAIAIGIGIVIVVVALVVIYYLYYYLIFV